MIVYHGSNSNFRKLRISKDLVKNQSTLENEGLGIYFSTDKEVARSYGKYLYTLEINDEYFIDFRKEVNCRLYIAKLAEHIHKSLKVNILKYIDIKQLYTGMYCGNLAISTIGKEIYLLLDSNEKWYREHSESKREKVYSMLKAYNKKHLQTYMFNYHIKNIGVIKKIDDNIVRIVSKE